MSRTKTITLTDEQAAGIAELIELAERGRADFTHQAAHGDYTAEDITAAETRWKAAQATAAALKNQQQRPGVIHPVIAAVEDWLPVAAGMDTENIWDHFTCIEAEATAAIAAAAGRADIAALILDLHAAADAPGDTHYQDPHD